MTAHDDDGATPPMHRRRTTMFDGRTMYYYSFGDEARDAEAHEHADATRKDRHGDSASERTEERDV